MGLAAVIFDFDGLILDSETHIYVVSASVLAAMGHGHLTSKQWSACVGLGDDDAWAALCRSLNNEPDRQDFERRFRSSDQGWRYSSTARPGVESLLDTLVDAEVACGVASSSPSTWVEGGLARLGLGNRFRVVACSDAVGGSAKPAPDVYQHALAALEVDPEHAVALEDSAHGVAAAQAAGLAVVAVPNEITQHTDLSAADHAVPDLTHLDLATLRAIRPNGRPERTGSAPSTM